MRKRLALGLAALFVVPAFGGTAHFHRAGTEPEKALERILQQKAQEAGRASDDYLEGRPGRKGNFDFTAILTPKLIASIRRAGRAQMTPQCFHGNPEGDICGFDFDPVSCDQADPDHYVFHTILDLGDKVVIEDAWPDEERPDSEKTNAVYTLVKRKHGWRIDGITCGPRYKFN